MKLGGHGIRLMFEKGDWLAYRGKTPLFMEELEPLIGPNSIDVTLGRHFLRPLGGPQDTVFLDDPTSLTWREYEADHLVIMPGHFFLGSVQERFDTAAKMSVQTLKPMGDGRFSKLETEQFAFTQMYEGRSTLGRLGIASHITAGFGDYGFRGAFTLELYNHFPRPVKLRAGMRIGQIAFEAVMEPMMYTGAYNGDDHFSKPMPPLLGAGRF